MKEDSRDSQAVRAAFTSQAGYCRRLGSPFTACVCEALAAELDMSSAAGRAILGWKGDPSPLADNVALRTIGALTSRHRSDGCGSSSPIHPSCGLRYGRPVRRLCSRAHPHGTWVRWLA